MEKENVLKGVLGGIIGSLAGVVAIVIFGQLGYVAALAGIIMAVCTIKLYQKFSGGMSKKGILVCSIIMVIMTLVGHNLAFAIQLVEELKEYGIEGDVLYIFLHLIKIMDQGLINMSTYVGQLIMVVLFNFVGAFSYFKNEFKKLSVKGNNINNFEQNNNQISNSDNSPSTSNNNMM